MYTPQTPDNKPEETKKETGETLPKTPQAEKGTNPTEEEKQAEETSNRITPPDPDSVPKDTVRDAKNRWDSESPAVKGHPQQHIPEDVNQEETENPDGDDEELLKKRDESGIA